MLDAYLLSRYFLDALKVAHPAIKPVEGGAPDFIATIRPDAPNVPPLSIWFNNNEITVVLGSLWHTHVDSCCANEKETPEAKAAKMASTAVAIVDDIISGRACFTATYKGNKLLSCSTQVGDRKSSTLLLPGEVALKGMLRAFFFRNKVVVYRWTGIETK